MANNRETIEAFYQAFSTRNSDGMNVHYHEEATFSDPVFQNLDAQQVKAMWSMLCGRGKDLKVVASNIQADETRGNAEWVATYTFAATGKKVTNRVRASFEFRDGKIVRHVDEFDFSTWCGMALGLMGKLFGGTAWLQNKVRTKANGQLARFIEKNR